MSWETLPEKRDSGTLSVRHSATPSSDRMQRSKGGLLHCRKRAGRQSEELIMSEYLPA